MDFVKTVTVLAVVALGVHLTAADDPVPTPAFDSPPALPAPTPDPAPPRITPAPVYRGVPRSIPRRHADPMVGDVSTLIPKPRNIEAPKTRREPSVAPDHARELLVELTAKLAERMTDAEVQEAVIAAQQKLEEKETSQRLSEVITTLNEIAGKHPGTEAGKKAKRAIEAMKARGQIQPLAPQPIPTY